MARVEDNMSGIARSHFGIEWRAEEAVSMAGVVDRSFFNCGIAEPKHLFV